MAQKRSLSSKDRHRSATKRARPIRQFSAETRKAWSFASLLGLPFELREMIFKYVFREYNQDGLLPIYHKHTGRSMRLTIGRTISSTDFLSVILVNRQLYKEASPLFFKWNHPHFELCKVKEIKEFLFSLPKTQTSKIRQLSFPATALRVQKGCSMNWRFIIDLLKLDFKLTQLSVDLPVDPDWAIDQITKHSPASEHGKILQAAGSMISCADNAFNRYSWRAAREFMTLWVEGFVTSTIVFKHPLLPSLGPMQVKDRTKIRGKLFAPFRYYVRKLADGVKTVTSTPLAKNVFGKHGQYEGTGVADHIIIGPQYIRTYTGNGSIWVCMANKSDLSPLNMDGKLLRGHTTDEKCANWFILSMLEERLKCVRELSSSA